MSLSSSKDLSYYKNFISLGANCFVAEDLKKFGLRNCSYPFDWLFCDEFSGVVSAIKLKFQDFMSPEFLLQHNDNRSRYYNEKYKLSFYHDFNKYLPLQKQICDVQSKYDRRINRFFEDISQPTVFFRYVISKNDYQYIIKESKMIDDLLKSFCPENRVIYLCHHEYLANCGVEWYLLDKDENDWITRTPLSKNNELQRILSEIEYEKKDQNIIFSSEFKNKKERKISLEKTLRRVLKKEYIHNRVYKKS